MNQFDHFGKYSGTDLTAEDRHFEWISRTKSKKVPSSSSCNNKELEANVRREQKEQINYNVTRGNSRSLEEKDDDKTHAYDERVQQPLICNCRLQP